MRHSYSRNSAAARYVYVLSSWDCSCMIRKSTQKVAVSSDDAYCPAPSLIWWCGTGQYPVFIGNKCILSIRRDGQIKSTGWTKILRIAVRNHRRLLNIDNANAVYGTWFVQTSQTKKFSTLLLNRGTVGVLPVIGSGKLIICWPPHGLFVKSDCVKT